MGPPRSPSRHRRRRRRLGHGHGAPKASQKRPLPASFRGLRIRRREQRGQRRGRKMARGMAWDGDGDRDGSEAGDRDWDRDGDGDGDGGGVGGGGDRGRENGGRRGGDRSRARCGTVGQGPPRCKLANQKKRGGGGVSSYPYEIRRHNHNCSHRLAGMRSVVTPHPSRYHFFLGKLPPLYSLARTRRRMRRAVPCSLETDSLRANARTADIFGVGARCWVFNVRWYGCGEYTEWGGPGEAARYRRDAQSQRGRTRQDRVPPRPSPPFWSAVSAVSAAVCLPSTVKKISGSHGY